MARVDPEAAAELMRAAGVEPLEPYSSAKAPWRCRCLSCGTEVSPSYDKVRGGQSKGCPRCSFRRMGDAKRMDEATARLVMEAAGVEPSEPYRGSAEPWRSTCRTCGREVSPSYGNVARGQRACKYCSGRAVDAAEATSFMRGHGWEPSAPYPGSGEPWPCRCTRCGTRSTPRYVGVVRGRGCSVCAGNAATDPLEAEALARSLSLIPLEPFPGGHVPWPCTCAVCGRDVAPHYSTLRSRGSACRYCGANPPVDSEAATSYMRSCGLDPEQPFPGSNSPWPCRCMKCGRRTSPRYAGVRSGKRCKYCAGNARVPAEAVASLQRHGFEPRAPYPGANALWQVQCQTCGRGIRVRLTHVEDGVGCRYCATRGFQYDKPGLVYVLTDESRGAHKVGIAGAATNRVDTLARDGWVAFKLRHFANGADAYTVEQAVLSWMRDDLELPPFLSAGDGWTETVSAEAMTVLRLWQKVSELADAVEANTNESCEPGPV